jgi:hypothetical protein
MSQNFMNADPVFQTGSIDSIFSRPPIFDIIFSFLSPRSLIRIGRTCRLAKTSVSLFYARAFNINRHLSHFFTNPIAFRSLQARTATLISGSNAVQFLDRSFYPESDLDLYVHPGHSKEVGMWLIEREGYTFVPNQRQRDEEFDFVDAELPELTPWNSTGPTATDDFRVEHYRISGLSEVYTFIKAPENGVTLPLKVQIMAAEKTPLQCILGFHSSE